eukprot:CAMPEP_0195518442 /NCGR_PEP_ID=MMETSP0794_2-20130614/12902_1 /TAXON_ID=515487 /ORGANISM="Stephanopyxis turris, Strain CCMP 815" /LENGTH=421 /DNA_ID=CAMNT_0040647405 /DNA_START=28 /DNA_END=1293 /DNA_ORIENTATION=-
MKDKLVSAAATAVAVFAAVQGSGAAAANVPTTNQNPTYAFTYTAEQQNWMSAVEGDNLEAVFVYAGDVEFYCRGSPTSVDGGGASPEDLACTFEGDSPNAFVYYSDFAKNASAAFKAAGKQVYINFDGRITPKVMSFVPDFSKLSATAISEFANATAAHVCNDPNVDGMAWDVEPFSNNQVSFFSQLDKHITACGKRWGVFAFGESFNEEMWTTGLGQSGFLFDSTYDLDCTAEQLPPNGCQPCQCTPPAVYETVLTEHLASVMALAKQYAKPYMLMVSGSGSTQLYEECTTSTCSGAGGGPVYNATCPYTMADWMEKAVKVFDTAGVKNDPNFEGIGVYGWTTTNGGGFSPVVPPSANLDVLASAGYLPYASPTHDNRVASVPKPVRASQHHDGNKCIVESDIKTCPQHYMVGSPMNVQV